MSKVERMRKKQLRLLEQAQANAEQARKLRMKRIVMAVRSALNMWERA